MLEMEALDLSLLGIIRTILATGGEGSGLVMTVAFGSGSGSLVVLSFNCRHHCGQGMESSSLRGASN